MEKNSIEHKVTMTIEPEPYAEMMQYAHRFSPDECSGVGLVERIDYDDNSIEFKVTKVFLPNQYNTCSTTDIPDEELNKLNTELVVAGEDTSKLKFHWHSHVDMSVFHSGTDDENYDDMQTGDFAVSLVVNKRGDMLGSVHLYDPMRISICNIEVEKPEVEDQYDNEKVTTNVTRVKEHEPALRRQHGVTTYVGGGYGGFATTVDEGLAYDPEFEELLVQGEKAGIITLFWDNFKNIYGYMNNRSNEVYLLASELQTYGTTTPAKADMSDKHFNTDDPTGLGGWHNDIGY